MRGSLSVVRPARRALLVVLLAAGCGGDSQPAKPAGGGAAGGGGGDTPAETADEMRDYDPASAGSLAGRVRVEGAVEPRSPRTAVAEGCAEHTGGSVPDESLLVVDGALLNAVAWVAEGLESWRFPAAEGNVILDQKGCLYLPHVSIARERQTIEVLNSDPLMHNVHAKPNKNKRANYAMPEGSASREFVFRRTELAVPFVCDVHPWMAAWVAVLPHPCGDITGEDGSFLIEGVPEGRHVLEVWHESLGARRVEVEVVAGQRTQVPEIVFAAP